MIFVPHQLWKWSYRCYCCHCFVDRHEWLWLSFAYSYFLAFAKCDRRAKGPATSWMQLVRCPRFQHFNRQLVTIVIQNGKLSWDILRFKYFFNLTWSWTDSNRFQLSLSTAVLAASSIVHFITFGEMNHTSCDYAWVYRITKSVSRLAWVYCFSLVVLFWVELVAFVDGNFAPVRYLK